MWRRFWRLNWQAASAVDADVAEIKERNRILRQWTSLTNWWESKAVGRSSAVLLLIAFFLGRAEILGELTPFALALYAVMLRLKKTLSRNVMIALLLGAATVHTIGYVISLVAMLAFYRIVHGMLSRRKSLSLNALPFVVFLVDTAARIAISMARNDMSTYSLMMSLVEGFLAMVLSLIFIQSLPIFTFQKGVKELRNEEIFCLVILMTSVLTGLSGIQVGSLSFENIFSRYLIMLFALIGGAGVGTSVGVVTGIILAMANLNAISQIGMLAFAGMLGGLLKDAKKVGVGIGFLLGTGILAVYVGQLPEIFTALQETLVAIVLLLFTPKGFIEQISRYVPGTHQHYLSQQDYSRRIRELMAGRIREVSHLFQELAHSFAQLSSGGRKSQDEALNAALEVVNKQVCTTCFKREICWEKDFYQTYHGFRDTIALIEAEGTVTKDSIPTELRKRCVRIEQILPALYQATDSIKRDMQWQNRLLESRELVAVQLQGVADIMEELTYDLTKENHMSAGHEEHIIAALEQLGLSIRSVDIISLEEGKIEIEVTQTAAVDRNECEKLIAPLLSEIVGENITVAEKRIHEDSGLMSIFRSAQVYRVNTAVASAAKDGKILSGDSFTTLDVGNGKFAVAVSDGMGNGERAMQESSAAIRLLQQLLKAGFDEQLAIKTVNSVLLLRSKDEIFTTMDLALIDQFNARTEFLKIGSVPSFVKRHHEVISIRGENVPIGILQDIDIQTVVTDLQEGDLLILMSDGIYDAPKHVDDKEKWLRKQIERFDSSDPQVVADLLVELAVRVNHGKIVDDMTVLVAKIEKHHPDWATIKLPGMKKIRRKKEASAPPIPVQGPDSTSLS
ncbi:stage II sporulation protein E [Effusibacillus dendaii]|uniref:Stage II sporulation protein E n=1 Tax=Effusibacillus dendaii TaxID=2743772 RepID=A0A7I8DBE5_9BACL|nr:stage II sporulation protein E [Effusibacillus dendaii]BCJ87394.1 stage II sporulation protein E [Effusibacillus dendaii]